MPADRVGRAYKLLAERRPQEALGFLAALDHGRPILSREVLYSLLEQCNRRPNLSAIRCTFSLVVNSGLDSTAYLGDHVIRVFASCGSLIEATQVFVKLLGRNVYTWNAIISAYIKLGQAARALEFFCYMQMDGVDPDKFVLSCILKACSCIVDARQGKLIHHYMVHADVKPDTILHNTLLDTYVCCGRLDEAWKVFDDLPFRDLVSWSTIITAYTNHGDSSYAFELYVRMKEECVNPDNVVFFSLLRASSNLGVPSYGRLLHDEIIKCVPRIDIALGSSLVDMYAKCSSIHEASKVFQELSHPSVVSWSTMISGFAEHGQMHMAFKYFGDMQQEGIKADKVVFLSILKACTGVGEMDAGRLIHAQILEADMEEDTMVGSTITVMYSKNGSLEDARNVFDNLSNRDVVAWATIIAGYEQMDQAATALMLFRRMEQEGVQPSIPTFLSSLRACSSVKDIDQGMFLHDEIIRSAFESDEAIGSSLIYMYAKFGDIEGSRKVFDKFPHLNEVSYGAMLAGYTEHGEGFLALCIFNEMGMRALQLDNVTFLYAIKACSNLGSLGEGRQIHQKLFQCGLETDLLIGNSLIEMYVKCLRLEEACKVFEIMPSRDVVSWSTLVSGYVQLTDGALVGYYLDEMQKSGFEVNETIFTSLLATCNHAGRIKAGYYYFMLMTAEHGILPSVEHYTCMIDLLGHAGCSYEAKELTQTMPAAPNIITQTALLNSCRAYYNISLGLQCFEQFTEIDFSDGSQHLCTYANVDTWT